MSLQRIYPPRNKQIAQILLESPIFSIFQRNNFGNKREKNTTFANENKEMPIPIELAKVVEIRLVCEISNPKFQNAYKQLKERLSKFKGVDMSQDTIRYSEDDPERNAIEEAIRKLPEELGWI